MTAPHTGGCRCGAVRLEASAEPHHISYCHCGDCRRASGAPVSAFVGFMADQVALTGKSLKSYRNGPVERSFCGICGSPIAYTDKRLDDGAGLGDPTGQVGDTATDPAAGDR